MKNSIALTLYRLWSSRAAGYGRKRLAQRLEAGKEDASRLHEREGLSSKPRPEGPLLWFHAASVGESLSILELIRQLQEERPALNILVTTGTLTSAQLMQDRLTGRAFHQFVPLDAQVFVANFLDHWQPDAAIWVESELWPALICEAYERGIPMALLNARMSAKSFRSWRWFNAMARSLLARFEVIQAQDQPTFDRLRALGAPADTTHLTGTLKEAAPALPCDPREHDSFSARLAGRPRWLAASTHAGEEEIVLAAHQRAAKKSHRLLLILAPRHPERGQDVVEMARALGLKTAQRSKGDAIERETQVYVADTLGDMGLWYRIAPVSFIGGSLESIGGHNPFEPAALGSAILSGRQVQNFADVYARLEEVCAVAWVSDADSLSETLVKILEPDVTANMAHAAWEVTSDGADVTQKAFDTIVGLLDAKTKTHENA